MMSTFSVCARLSVLFEILRLETIEAIYKDELLPQGVPGLHWSRPAVGATNPVRVAGQAGERAVIGVLDTGIGPTASLAWNGAAVFTQPDDPDGIEDVYTPPSKPQGIGHGTAVAGIIRSGLQIGSDDHTGIAPSCTLLSARIFRRLQGDGLSTWVRASLGLRHSRPAIRATQVIENGNQGTNGAVGLLDFSRLRNRQAGVVRFQIPRSIE